MKVLMRVWLEIPLERIKISHELSHRCRFKGVSCVLVHVQIGVKLPILRFSYQTFEPLFELEVDEN